MTAAPLYRMCRTLGRVTWIMIIDTAPARPIKAKANRAPQKDAMKPRNMLPTVSMK
jgi:hypothetical protein